MKYERLEYPRPQFARKDWVNLNGEWTCHISRKPKCFRDVGSDDEKIHAKGFETKINVPFSPETVASGVHANEIIDTIWYQRFIQIPAAWDGKCILLHFGAVFYHSEVYVDGTMAGFHDGGSSSFSVDLTGLVRPGARHSLIVKATVNLQDGSIPSGKQSSYIASYACFYQRTTGIWQTIWMEAVDKHALRSVNTYWNEAESNVYFIPSFRSIAQNMRIHIKIGNKKTIMTAISGIPIVIHIENPVLWEPGNAHLYDITYSVYLDETCVDEVSSYIGLRTIQIIGNNTYINGKKLYYRFVLDQGFYPEGNWTAPSDEALEKDIKLALSAGFNGARLHQKVFEERYLHYADRLGFLVWEETPSWGLDYNNEGLPARNFLHELTEIVNRDKNHPSIIGWSPLNETWCFNNPKAHRRLHKEAYETIKGLDPTRPVNDASGYIHYLTDLWTVHTYVQGPNALYAQLSAKNGNVFRNFPDFEPLYSGQPYIVDEYGGVKWDPETQAIENLAEAQNLQSWGYGKAPSTGSEFLDRISRLTQVILSLSHISGYCYTQLTDVEQEKNGLYFYSRESKFSPQFYYAIFSQKPKGYEL